MYLRNVKQILRGRRRFDERRYGFGGLMDLLKACQRDGLRAHRARSPRRPARLPGPALAGTSGAAADAPRVTDRSNLPQPDVENELMDEAAR